MANNKNKKVMGAAALTAAIAGGGAIGMLLSGFVIEHFDWPAVFLVVVPVVVASLVAGWFLVPTSRDPESSSLDIPGAVTLHVHDEPAVALVEHDAGAFRAAHCRRALGHSAHHRLPRFGGVECGSRLPQRPATRDDLLCHAVPSVQPVRRRAIGRTHLHPPR